MAALPRCGWLSWARTNGSTTPSVSRGLITTRTSEMAASWPLAIFSGPTNRWIWPRAAPTATVSGTRVSMAKKDISAAGPVTRWRSAVWTTCAPSCQGL